MPKTAKIVLRNELNALLYPLNHDNLSKSTLVSEKNPNENIDLETISDSIKNKVPPNVTVVSKPPL